MHRMCWGLMLVFMLACGPTAANGEFYRYKDENGVLRFTDNLQEVPADQRPGLKKYKEAEDDMTPAQLEKKRRQEAEAAQRAKIRSEQARKGNEIEEARIDSHKDLERVKADLDEEHESLMNRKAGLQAERDTLTTAEEVRAYQEKIRNLNEEIKRFEERRRQFVKKADQFNALKK